MRPLVLLGFLLGAAVPMVQAKVEHVILISVDGMRGDFLKTLVETAPAEVPNFKRLRDLGASTFNARSCHTWSFTVGNHLSMVTGRPVLQGIGVPGATAHGYTNNAPPPGSSVHADGNPAVTYKASVFDAVHDHGKSTGAFFHKSTLNVILTSYDATHGAPDLVGPDNGTNKIDVVRTPDGYPAAPALITVIEEGQLPAFTMLHIAEVDLTGHGWGWTVAEGAPYRAAVQTADGYIGGILDALLAQPAYAAKTAIIVTADHGGGEGNFYNHGPETLLGNVTIPFMIWGPGIMAGTDAYQWFENRHNPAEELPSYFSPSQPLRNVDSGNLVAQLLGVPPIPGSFCRPMLKRALKVARRDENVAVTWPLYLNGYTLEATDDLVTGHWQPITVGVQELSDHWEYVEPLSPTKRRMFRLRGP